VRCLFAEAKLQSSQSSNVQRAETANGVDSIEQETALRRNRDDRIHEAYAQVVSKPPTLLKEALRATVDENPMLHADLSAAEHTLCEKYRQSPMFWIFIDKHLQKQFPERFQGVIDACEVNLYSSGH